MKPKSAHLQAEAFILRRHVNPGPPSRLHRINYAQAMAFPQGRVAECSSDWQELPAGVDGYNSASPWQC
jgi:hypothetical protein